jgi:hypothetical protein
MKLNLKILKGKYAIYRLKTDSDIPDWIKNSDFYCITRTKESRTKQSDLMIG